MGAPQGKQLRGSMLCLSSPLFCCVWMVWMWLQLSAYCLGCMPVKGKVDVHSFVTLLSHKRLRNVCPAGMWLAPVSLVRSLFMFTLFVFTLTFYTDYFASVFVLYLEAVVWSCRRRIWWFLWTNFSNFLTKLSQVYRI